MQALNWYYRRFQAMSPSEVLWRVHSVIRDCADRLLVGWRQRSRKSSRILSQYSSDTGPAFHVYNMPLGQKAQEKTDNKIGKQWYDSLLARAENIIEHRLSFFDLKNEHLGNPIIWNRDHKRRQDTPMVFSPSLDYRDVRKAGDCKYVWEPNRHHQFVVLGRAYRHSGERCFAEAVAEQLDSWLKQNPFGAGMNWRSGLELGIRLINWVWALDLIEESKVISDELYLRIMDSISRHIWEIDRKYSRGSSVNNHLIGEAAGVFVASSYFKNLKHASKWRDRSREILNWEIINQTYPDGGIREQAIGYHIFVLQFFVIAGITARASGQDFSESYWSRLEKMFDFTAKLCEGGDNLPMLGDCDDGYVLDMGDNPHSIKQWLEIGAALFGRGDFMAAASRTEPIEYSPGQSRPDKYDIPQDSKIKKFSSIAFNQTGYYLLQHGGLDSSDRISVVFDCGPLGIGTLAAHGHADALSFTLRAFGKDVLVDPGTYDYFSYPKWREYFRSTRSHNTIVVDSRDQSEMLGLFLWGRKAEADCLSWQPTDEGGKVIGKHDGYMHLDDPVTHKRMLDLDGRELVVRDDIITCGKHQIEVFFHFAEYCIVNPVGKNRYLVDVGPGTIEIELDNRLTVETFKGSEEPICGWVSRSYHQKQASTTLVGCCTVEGNTCLVCRVDIGKMKRANG